jgi:hypothetical protein
VKPDSSGGKRNEDDAEDICDFKAVVVVMFLVLVIMPVVCLCGVREVNTRFSYLTKIGAAFSFICDGHSLLLIR